MSYSYAEQVKNLQPSAIREILKYTSDPEVVPLSAGNPAPEAFPLDMIVKFSNDILTNNPMQALQYSTTEGYLPLRNSIKDFVKTNYNIGKSFDEMVITSGAQQAIELVTKVMCNAGDVIVCESPSFTGSLNSFRSIGGELIGIPIEGHEAKNGAGINITQLENVLKTNKKVKLLYLIPNFQNPSGITMSLQKRQAVYDLACKYDIVIIEDDPYHELRYSGENVPTIKSLDTQERVVYCGSFSKIIAPGLRVGFAVGPSDIIQKMVVCKQGEDVHTSMWSQMICANFLSWDGFNNHLDNLRSIYTEKSNYMIELIEKHLVPTGITYEPIQGGLFIWCKLPKGTDMQKFCINAVEQHKVAVVPGSAFIPEQEKENQSLNFRINFSTPTNEKMNLGINRLGNFSKEFLA